MKPGARAKVDEATSEWLYGLVRQAFTQLSCAGSAVPIE